MRRGLSTILAWLVAGFCWVTMMYAFVSASAFAYQQFIKPNVFRWVGVFSHWHVVLFWIWCALLVVAIGPDLRRGGLSRRLALTLVSLAVFAGWRNTVHPVLPSLVDGTRSVVVGMVAIVPVLWMALLDHLRSAPLLRRAGEPAAEHERRSAEGRLFVAGLGATLLVAVAYAVPSAFRIAGAFEPDLQGAGMAVGMAASMADLGLVFLTASLVLAAVGRAAGVRFRLHYALLLSALALLAGWMCGRVLTGSIGLVGTPARVAAALAGVSLAAFWGGQCLRRSAARGERPGSAVDVFLSPPPSSAFDGRAAVGLMALGPLASVLFALATRVDWDFVLMHGGVTIVWAAAFIAVCRVTPLQPRVGNWSITIASLVLLALNGLVAGRPAAYRILDRYAVYNPSFRLADSLVRHRPEAPSFERYLRAHTGLTDVTVAPASIDFVQPLAPARGEKPLIFLLVIDSLRPDYLSPYNTDVRFTPRIQRFADENLVFANAFTRYGGTGLSMPAIWAGSAIVHKQYVQPFAPMNALQKLLDVNGYTRLISRDHITGALWTTPDGEVELDQGRGEMDFDFCRTLGEMTGRLRSGMGRGGRVFAQTRSLNLHVASVRNGYVPPGRMYPGFEPPYAWRVERMDGCFGRFIDDLKALKLYERSVVVLTADHGELIGEDGRWGHSYHMFPEVIQVPLIVHVPDALRGASADLHAVSLSTDITPMLYAALGYRPERPNGLMGHPLIGSAGEAWTSRRRDSQVLAASYGAVYAVLSGNGRRLYIADAIKGGDLAYRRTGRRWRQVDVEPGMRMTAQLRIRRHVDELARLYQIDRRF